MTPNSQLMHLIETRKSNFSLEKSTYLSPKANPINKVIRKTVDYKKKSIIKVDEES